MPDEAIATVPALHLDAQAITRTSTLLINRDYMLLWGGQVVSTLGSSATSIVYPLLILALTNSPSAAGVAAALRTSPYLIFCLPVGALIDRSDPVGLVRSATHAVWRVLLSNANNRCTVSLAPRASAYSCTS